MSKIVIFHEVTDALWFKNAVLALKKKYQFVSLPELINFYKDGIELKNICHLTVDDGNKSFYSTIFPVLKELEIPASLFVSPYIAVNRSNFWFQEVEDFDAARLFEIIGEFIGTGKNIFDHFLKYNVLKCLRIDDIWEIIYQYKAKYNIDNKPCQNMTTEEIQEVEDSGLVTIGAHTLRHPVLTNEKSSLSEKEIASSIKELANLLGHEVKYFAYPNGIPGVDFGHREINILKANGCICSFSTEVGNFSQKSDLYSIPRYGITNGDKLLYTKAKFTAGKQWNRIMKLKPQNEITQRRMLSERLLK